MKKYMSYFKLRFNVALQYRASAIAGMCTQFFWGMMQILIYIAFYENASGTTISLEQLVSYVWLRQAFYSLINHVTDGEIKSSIENGNISYEIIKPIDLYWIWFSKNISSRLALALLKCIPLLIITPLLPAGINLNGPVSFLALVLFGLSLFIGMFIMSAILNLFYISVFYTMTSKGTMSIFYGVLEFFGGGFIPIALMPNIWQKICYLLPISLATDLPFRIYTGNIDVLDGLKLMSFQLVWIVVLIILGNILLNRILKKVVIQGG